MGDDGDGWGEIIDPENDDSRGGSEKTYSFEQLVMMSMRKCLEAGSKEMIEGYFNEKQDRAGNLIRIYVQDTRNVFIRSVKLLMALMKRIFDKHSNKEVRKILGGLEKVYKELCGNELKEMYDAPSQLKRQRMIQGITNAKGKLNKNLSFYQDYINEEVDSYLKIFESLSSLAQRKGLGQEEVLHA